jgi:hypothetical protein
MEKLCGLTQQMISCDWILSGSRFAVRRKFLNKTSYDKLPISEIICLPGLGLHKKVKKHMKI